MRNLNRSLFHALAILGLIAGALASQTAAAQTAQQNRSYWRALAKKNFLEGFCVGQALSAKQITFQSGQQIDQAMVNTIKTTIAACKSGNQNSVNPPANAPQPSPAVVNSPPQQGI